MKRSLLALCAASVALCSLPAKVTPNKAAPAAPAPAASETKKDAEQKIEGIEIARSNGTYLGVTLDQGKFKLSFYDKKKKPMRADALRCVARWPNPHGPGQNRTVMNPLGDGMAMMGPTFVRGPYSFRLSLTLVKSEDGESTENYAVDFHN